ncbi:MAG: hypothetical protein INQ03_10070 [Candidatus Heimdallarchaeota archaeon]|nr:hypothetical protein [Candidatus Heimdallarchaeota archaeon]
MNQVVRIENYEGYNLDDYFNDKTKITHLTIINCPNLSNIIAIQSLIFLKNLYIKNCKSLIYLPSFERFEKLESIYINKCPINQLPIKLLDLPNLSQIIMISTEIKHLPSEIKNISGNKKKLTISYSKLEEIPGGNWGYNWDYISFCGNKINVLPNDISFNFCRWLDIRNNLITTIPESLYKSNINTLSLAGNKLDSETMIRMDEYINL